MMIRAWRISRPEYVRTAFDGEGAKLHGGRWNSKGTAVVYASESKALAALELLVHVESSEVLDRYLCLPVEFDERLAEILDPLSLPADWRDSPPPASTRAVGDAWVATGKTPVLCVPSVVVPGESNYMMNPAHAEFGGLKIGPPEPFEFDPRILKLEP